MTKALVIRHLAFEDLGNLASVLNERGITIDMFEAGVHRFIDVDPLAYSLLIVLGGPIGVYDAGLYPFLQDEIDFIKIRLKNRLPTLGICLGAQLMAHALGAKVFPGPQKEIGWSPLTLTKAGENNYFANFASSTLKVLHWHGDTFDLPDGATLLASTSLYPHQAFSFGNYALGLQYHLEVLPQHFEQWLIGHSCELSKTKEVDIFQLRRDANIAGKLLQPHAIKFWHAWLDSVDLK